MKRKVKFQYDFGEGRVKLEGIFHQWGNMIDYDGTGHCHQITCAVIECTSEGEYKGQTFTAYPALVTFVDVDEFA